MADFNKYIPTLKRWEGGFVNDPSDKGGATMCGVTIATFRRFYGETKTVADLKAMTDTQWRTIMKSYWDRCRADEIRNQSIAEILVDWYINAGAAGIKFWQRSAGINTSGVIGVESLNILNAPASAVIFLQIKTAREAYYRSIVAKNPRQAKFLNGWLNRVNSFQYED